MSNTVYLQLENGTLFAGKGFGAPLTEDITAEVVFTTAMTGYVETLTDPSYYGQMVVQTFPLIGNYGVNPIDFESKKIHMSAYITKEYCTSPSNFRCKYDIDTLLKENNIPGIYDIDTRFLTKIIRDNGVMNGIISTKKPDLSAIQTLSSYSIKDAVETVSCKNLYEIPSSICNYSIVLWDFGAKQNIIRKLNSLGCHITVVPAHTSYEEILALKPDGIMLSNGPGNPKDNTFVINELKKLCQSKLPIFGICLGHQLLALANGADTEKLKYGHRGGNQPVKDVNTCKIYITSQNHGYAVKTATLKSNAKQSFINVNDNTCEGIEYTDFPGFSVQFHPEACAGPHDTEYLFNKFIELIERSK